jgi:hypothetical protein
VDGEALASAGCDAVNAGGFNDSIGPGGNSTKTVAGFSVGDAISFSISTLGGPQSWTLKSGNGTTVNSFFTAFTVTQTESYTVTGNNQDTTLSQTINDMGAPSPGVSVTATCTAAAAPSPPANTDSAKLRALQIAASQIVGQSSGAAISNAVSGAIDDAFGSGGGFFTGGPNGFALNFAAEPQGATERRVDDAFAALGYARGERMATKAPALAPPPVAPREWLAWADVRDTGWRDDNAASGFSGHQANVTAGLTRRLSSDLAVGLVTGYERFGYTFASIAGTFKGDGWTVGGYGAWRFAPHWRLDGLIAWSDISYDAAAGTASGAFTGRRWLGSAGVTGSYALGALVVEPSSRVYALSERQTAWTDSLGTLQAARDFSAGRVANGARLVYPWQTSSGSRMSPYVGFYGDYRFATANAVPAGQPVVGIGNGWSGRFTTGVNFTSADGTALSLNGEYGGLGAPYKVWTAKARLRWPL